MRWVGVAIVVSLGVLGCGRANPSFGDDGTGSSGDGSRSDSASESDTQQSGVTGSDSRTGTNGTSNGPASLTDSQGGTTSMGDPTEPIDLTTSESGFTTTGTDLPMSTGPDSDTDAPACAMPQGTCNPNTSQPLQCPMGELCRPWGDPTNPGFGCFALTVPALDENEDCESYCGYGGNDSGCGERTYCDTRGDAHVCRRLCDYGNEQSLCAGQGSCVVHVLNDYGGCYGECDPLLENPGCEKGEVCAANLDEPQPMCHEATEGEPSCTIGSCPQGQLCVEGDCRAACDALYTCTEGTECTPLLDAPPMWSRLGYCPAGLIPTPIGKSVP